MKIAISSGKGGTGKTSLVVSLAVLTQKVVLADCNVNAAGLYLVLKLTIAQRGRFSGGSRARILPDHGTASSKCEEVCRFDAISCDGPGCVQVNKTFHIDPIAWEGCGVRVGCRAVKAIEFAHAETGTAAEIKKIWSRVSPR